MDAKELRELIEIISRSDFATFELEREGFKLKLVRAEAGQSAQPTSVPAVPVAPAAPAPAATAAAAPAPAPVSAQAAAPTDGLVEMTSPIVGTFYRSASPTASPFVDVGSRIKKGDVLCIVEAMKLMNEIESEIDAEVAEVVPQNGQPVEFGEVLFRLKPLG